MQIHIVPAVGHADTQFRQKQRITAPVKLTPEDMHILQPHLGTFRSLFHHILVWLQQIPAGRIVNPSAEMLVLLVAIVAFEHVLDPVFFAEVHKGISGPG